MAHGQLTTDWADGTYTFRLGLNEIGELEAKHDRALMVVFQRLRDRAASLAEIMDVLRLGLIGAGEVRPSEALRLVRRHADERPIEDNRDTALAIVLQGLMRVHSDQLEQDVANDEAVERVDMGAVHGIAAMLGIHDVGKLSLGEWASIVAYHNKVHGNAKPPSGDELDAAIERVRGRAS